MAIPAGLYAILDLPHGSGQAPAALAAALIAEGAGAAMLQLRAKGAGGEARASALAAIAPVCAAYGVPLIANDDAEAALAVPGVSGVHLGQGDLPEEPAARRVWLLELRARGRGRGGRRLVIGVSTHSLAQVAAAQELPIDYLGFGPVFATRSKERPEPTVGLEGLAAAAAASALPVVAIGGLDAARGRAAIAAGARAAAVIGALSARSLQEIRARSIELARALAGAPRPDRTAVSG